MSLPSEIVLKVGKPAPFTGVLLGEKRYRTYVANEIELASVREDLDFAMIQLKGIELNQAEIKKEETGFWTPFIAGFSIGVLSAVLATRK